MATDSLAQAKARQEHLCKPLSSRHLLAHPPRLPQSPLAPPQTSDALDRSLPYHRYRPIPPRATQLGSKVPTSSLRRSNLNAWLSRSDIEDTATSLSRPA